MEYRFTSTFVTVAKVVSPSSEDRFVAKASLAPLKSMLPTDIDPLESPDLLFFSCNGAVAGLVNKNADAISCDTALEIYNTAKNKYVSTDHDREKIVGVVLYPGFSKFGSNETLTFEQASELKEPFNMAFAGVLWKVINPMLSKYLANNGGIGEDALSMSWEIAFNSYSIGVGSKNLFDAKIIKADDPNFEAYDRYLKSNKGEGKDPSGQEVFRVIGNDSIILGYSIVPNPAAEVKGIIPIDGIVKSEVDNKDKTENADNAASEIKNNFNEIPESQRTFLTQLKSENASDINFSLYSIIMDDGTIHELIPIIACRYLPKGIDVTKIASIKICQKNEEKIITSSDASVNLNIEKTMKITNLQELESEISKFEGKAAVVDFVKQIQQASEEYVKNLEKQEKLTETAEAAKVENAKRAEKLEASLAEVQKQLDALQANAEAAEAAQKFQERMASFDEAFNLDADDIKLIASDIADLDDEAFATYLTKSKKLMAAKLKTVDTSSAQTEEEKKAAELLAASKKNDDDDDDGDKKGKKQVGMKASLVKAALASILEDKTQTALPRDGVQTDDNVVAAMAEAFGGSFKIDGKAVKPTKKETKK